MSRGARIRYSAEELAFIEARQAMPRKALLAAFVQAFGREDVRAEHLKGLCSRRGWTTSRREWTEDDDAELTALYPDTPTAAIARRIGRTVAATYGRADKLGLAKSEAYLASPAAGRTNGRQGMGTRFQKGHVPANKGLRRPGWGPGRMKESQFKKGQPGSRTMALGSERLVDGYRYTKVSEIQYVPWTVNWKQTHVLTWEQANGPVPPGHAVVFRNGDKLDVRLENLECVSRADLMRRNSVHNLPAPLPQLVQLIGAVNRKINRRQKAHEEQDRGSEEPPVRGAGRALGSGQANGDRAREGDRRRGARRSGLRSSGDTVPERGRRDEGHRVHRRARGGAAATATARQRRPVAIRASAARGAA